jgi:nitrite reductase/ring-hydroxylating ferredoxin subunit/Fe-S cluster biogenesis protein NfuA
MSTPPGSRAATSPARPPEQPAGAASGPAGAASGPAGSGRDGADVDALATQLDAVLARSSELDPLARQTMRDGLDALNAIHRQGLTAIVRRLRADPRGKELLFELVDDAAVRMILSMHGIIRSADPLAVAEQVLESIRPGIRSHGGDVALDRIEDGVAYVRLSGACNGCSMASVTMRDGVERALVEGVASVTSVEVLPDEPAAAPLLQITIAGAGEAPAQGGWVRTFPADRIAAGALEAVSLRRASAAPVEAIIVNAGGRLAAYVNACAHQGRPLDNAIVDATAGTLTCPWHGFCYDATSGECLTMPGAQLEQLPLRIDDGHVWVRAGG